MMQPIKMSLHSNNNNNNNDNILEGFEENLDPSIKEYLINFKNNTTNTIVAINRLESGSFMLTISAIVTLLVIILFPNDLKLSSAIYTLDQSWPILLCAIYLALLIYVIIFKINANRTVHSRLNADNTLRVKHIQSTLLISSSLWTTALAIYSNKLIVLQAITMFVIYALLAVSNRRALIATSAANLSHLLTFLILNAPKGALNLSLYGDAASTHSPSAAGHFVRHNVTAAAAAAAAAARDHLPINVNDPSSGKSYYDPEGAVSPHASFFDGGDRGAQDGGGGGGSGTGNIVGVSISNSDGAVGGGGGGLSMVGGHTITAATDADAAASKSPRDNLNYYHYYRHLLIIVPVYIIFHAIGWYLNEKAHCQCSQSFVDIKKDVAGKIMMDIEDKKLTKLMESVIPIHLAGQMRQDIMEPKGGHLNFHKVYLDSFGSVSILFADIVNFTKISSSCSPQSLVQSLNELFGRFDKAADKNGCLRIKILGDCYYCVSGIPDMNQEHAKQSVEMALDMIDILRELKQDNCGVDLNMRVGIHSGRVLCGVLGKKKWQFDVYSNDVKLANHMEQAGIPGRVHITETTLNALGSQYQVEPGNGSQRDTYIAHRNIATYFVIPPSNRRASMTAGFASGKLITSGSVNVMQPDGGGGGGGNSNAAAELTATKAAAVDIGLNDKAAQVVSRDAMATTGGKKSAAAAAVAALPAGLVVAETETSLATADDYGGSYCDDDNDDDETINPKRSLPLRSVTSLISATGVQSSELLRKNDRARGDSNNYNNNKRGTKTAANNNNDDDNNRNSNNTATRSLTSLIRGPKETQVSVAPSGGVRVSLLNMYGGGGCKRRGCSGSGGGLSSGLGKSVSAAAVASLTMSLTSTTNPQQQQQQRQQSANKAVQSGGASSNQLVPAPQATSGGGGFAGRLTFKQATQRIMNVLHFIKTIDAPFANLMTANVANAERIMLETIESRCKIDDVDHLTLKFKDKSVAKLYGSPNILSLIKGSVVHIMAVVAFAILAYDTMLSHDFMDEYSGSSNINRQSNLTAVPANATRRDIDINNSSSTGASLIIAANQEILVAFLLVFLMAISVYIHGTELEARRDFVWCQAVIRDKERIRRMRNCNRSIFFNLLPPHVASYFLENKLGRSHMELYHQSYGRIGVMFATIPNFDGFYQEVDGNKHGLECLRLLNEIICDFDSLLDKPEFVAVDKIKTIGSTYMVAIGLSPSYELPSDAIAAECGTQSSADNNSCQQLLTNEQLTLDRKNIREGIAKYLQTLVEFALVMRAKLHEINKHSYNNFNLRIGINLGPVVAGVIGATKPQYDIWGNTVNVASRMESTADPDKIQITQEVYELLNEFNDQHGFDFTCRGTINVKGKGYMTTYYLAATRKTEKKLEKLLES